MTFEKRKYNTHLPLTSIQCFVLFWEIYPYRFEVITNEINNHLFRRLFLMFDGTLFLLKKTQHLRNSSNTYCYTSAFSRECGLGCHHISSTQICTLEIQCPDGELWYALRWTRHNIEFNIGIRELLKYHLAENRYSRGGGGSGKIHLAKISTFFHLPFWVDITDVLCIAVCKIPEHLNKSGHVAMSGVLGI